MANFRKTVLAAATLVALGVSSQASALVIGGIDVGSGPIVTLTDASSETIVTAAGQTLYGVGQITKVNGVGYSGGELDFVYTALVSYISPDGSTIIFSSGTLDFYVNPLGTYDSVFLGAGSMAAAMNTLDNGTNWLNLKTTTVPTIAPYNVAGAPATGGFFGNGSNLAGTTPNGNGVGYMSVDTTGSGLANSFFNTDQLVGPGGITYDFNFTSTFSVPGSNPVWGPVLDASTFSGRITVPEPGTLALLGLGLAGIGLRKRKPKAVAATTVA